MHAAYVTILELRTGDRLPCQIYCCGGVRAMLEPIPRLCFARLDPFAVRVLVPILIEVDRLAGPVRDSDEVRGIANRGDAERRPYPRGERKKEQQNRRDVRDDLRLDPSWCVR